jgi:hypothetical protein
MFRGIFKNVPKNMQMKCVAATFVLVPCGLVLGIKASYKAIKAYKENNLN